MIRILFYLVVVLALGLGFAWLADRPGDMVVTFSGYRYQVSLMVAAVGIVAVVAATMIAWWLVRSIWNSPYAIARHFRVRRRDRGYQALSTGMIAAGAGDAALARRKGKKAGKLINADQEPLIHLLEAQTALLEGDHDAARRKFEAMLDDPETRLLGLRGLYLEAERLGDRNAARHYAGRAAAVAPQLGWATESTIEELAARAQWDGALELVAAQKSTKRIEPAVANRQRAVLLTAKAADVMDTDPAAAKAAALEANKLQPEFVPAALAAAKMLLRNDDVRKASKILEHAWRAAPHPEVADLYIHARSGDAVLDRLKRARKLQDMKKNHAEASLAVARAAFDANDYRSARTEAEAAIRLDAREGAYLLLADIEEAETGDEGKVRQWLAKAVRAPRDPAWVADGVVAEHWAPVSPVTGRLDAFEWRAPVERLGHLIDSGADEEAGRSVPAIPAPATEERLGEVAEVIEAGAPAPEKPVVEAPEKTDIPEKPVSEKPIVVTEAAKPAPPRPEPVKKAGADKLPLPPDVESAHRQDFMPRLPDDPGVDPDEDREPETARFKLF
jgi:HemY protein